MALQTVLNEAVIFWRPGETIAITCPPEHTFVTYSKSIKPSHLSIEQPGRYEVDVPIADPGCFPIVLMVVRQADLEAYLAMPRPMVVEMINAVIQANQQMQSPSSTTVH